MHRIAVRYKNASVIGFGPWHALGDGLNDLPHSIVVDGTDVYVGGKFTSAGNAPARYIARLDTQTDTWSTLGDGVK